MNTKNPSPGVTRDNRISDEGLQRLEKQLATGININSMVLAQWIKRYGEPAKDIIRRYGQYDEDFDLL